MHKNGSRMSTEQGWGRWILQRWKSAERVMLLRVEFVDFISRRQLVRDGGGRVESCLKEM